MNIPNLHPPRWMPESEALRLEPESLASAIAGKPKRKPDRYSIRNDQPCAACKSGRHSACVSLRCACPVCNPEVK